MSYKILEANGVDNENIDGGALNNLIARDKNGIVNGVLSECALTATGSLIGISPGLLILHGIRVKITEMETLTMANAPASATKYQIVAQVVLSSDGGVAFSFLVQTTTSLKKDELYAKNEGTYQIEFGTFTQNADGTISNLKRTVQTLYESETQMREDLDFALGEIEDLHTATKNNAQGIEKNATSIERNARNITQNAAHIQNLYSIARENGQFAVLETEQAYTTRETADGAEIFDNQYTPVLEIKGSTVNSINKYNLTEAKNDVNPGSGTSVTVLENGFLVVGIESSNPYYPSYANGWFRAGGNKYKVLPAVKTGDVLNVSVDITLVEDENKLSLAEAFEQYPNAGRLGAFFYDDSSNQAGGQVFLSLSNTTAKQTKTFSCTVPEAMNGKKPYLIINLNSFTMKIENIMVTINEDLPSSFIPYFSDLKHAHINAIKSTGRNLFNINDFSAYIQKDATDENYFTFTQSPLTFLDTKIVKFAEPKNVYVKIKYKLTDASIANHNRGVVIQVEKQDGSTSELSTYLNRDGESSNNFTNVVEMRFSFGTTYLNQYIGEFIVSFEDVPYEPYTEEIYELPETLELGEWDSFNPQTGEVTVQTKRLVLNGEGFHNTNVEEDDFTYVYDLSELAIDKANEVNVVSTLYSGIANSEVLNFKVGISANGRYLSVFDNTTDIEAFKEKLAETPLIVDYKLATPTNTKIENVPKQYKAWNHGSETIIQGETDNSVYGAMPTITNEYFVAVSAEEVTDE